MKEGTEKRPEIVFEGLTQMHFEWKKRMNFSDGLQVPKEQITIMWLYSLL